jgi:Ca-activated chloride channel homolog
LKYFFFLLFSLTAKHVALAQKTDAAIRKGNQLYQQGQFDAAQQAYAKALAYNTENPVAHYNNGNAQYRSKKLEQAVTSFDSTIHHTNKKVVKEKAFYNKGVALAKQQKLEESIAAWKSSLKLDPTDKLARENLQKALQILKQKQQKEGKKDKEKKKEQEKENNKKDQPQPLPTPPQSKLKKQQVDQLLKAMEQKEKEVQKRLQNANASSPNKPEKDW